MPYSPEHKALFYHYVALSQIYARAVGELKAKKTTPEEKAAIAAAQHAVEEFGVEIDREHVSERMIGEALGAAQASVEDLADMAGLTAAIGPTLPPGPRVPREIVPGSPEHTAMAMHYLTLNAIMAAAEARYQELAKVGLARDITEESLETLRGLLAEIEPLLFSRNPDERQLRRLFRQAQPEAEYLADLAGEARPVVGLRAQLETTPQLPPEPFVPWIVRPGSPEIAALESYRRALLQVQVHVAEWYEGQLVARRRDPGIERSLSLVEGWMDEVITILASPNPNERRLRADLIKIYGETKYLAGVAGLIPEVPPPLVETYLPEKPKAGASDAPGTGEAPGILPEEPRVEEAPVPQPKPKALDKNELALPDADDDLLAIMLRPDPFHTQSSGADYTYWRRACRVGDAMNPPCLKDRDLGSHSFPDGAEGF